MNEFSSNGNGVSRLRYSPNAPHIKTLHQLKWDPNKPYDPGPVILSYQLGARKIPLAYKHTILSIYGKHKSRKSLLAEGIAASRFSQNPNDCLNFQLNLESDKKTVRIETEQGRERFQASNRRIIRMSRKPDIAHAGQFESWWLVASDHREKLDQVDHIVRMTPNIGFLILDQVADLVAHENDDTSVRELQERLVHWRDSCDLIAPIVHTNRGGKDMNGKLGSMLDKKSDNGILCSYDSETKLTSAIHAIARGRSIPSGRDGVCFLFTHSEDGKEALLIDDDMHMEDSGLSEQLNSFVMGLTPEQASISYTPQEFLRLVNASSNGVHDPLLTDIY